ncbi:hypothetical protein [Aureispira sp. CCB-QB1]|uniref:hypothetical protein n=1 Tax=Aureispira sp. CCB-QB1 TaxID=1313421 RepID=UPI0006983E9B|nr:hypothetical protein [Aureispira sp. CCB-QB1]
MEWSIYNCSLFLITCIYLNSVQHTLQFQSTVSVFLTYLILKAAPAVAVVYYFFTWQLAILSAVLLLAIILAHSAYTNHNFQISKHDIQISPSISITQQVQTFDYKSIEYIEIKYSQEKDNKQWLAIQLKNNSKIHRFRCDWLHMQDPPDEDEDDHGHPEHELFELLEDEDFYEGSLQQLSTELRNRGVEVREV